jgi:hypothetical protein
MTARGHWLRGIGAGLGRDLAEDFLTARRRLTRLLLDHDVPASDVLQEREDLWQAFNAAIRAAAGAADHEDTA